MKPYTDKFKQGFHWIPSNPKLYIVENADTASIAIQTTRMQWHFIRYYKNEDVNTSTTAAVIPIGTNKVVMHFMVSGIDDDVLDSIQGILEDENLNESLPVIFDKDGFRKIFRSFTGTEDWIYQALSERYQQQNKHLMINRNCWKVDIWRTRNDADEFNFASSIMILVSAMATSINTVWRDRYTETDNIVKSSLLDTRFNRLLRDYEVFHLFWKVWGDTVQNIE